MSVDPSSGEFSDPYKGEESRSTLKTALKIVFWFGMLCVILVSLLGCGWSIVRSRSTIWRVSGRSGDWNVFGQRPNAPVEVIVDSSDDWKTPGRQGSSDASAMPQNNEAATADTELTGAHQTARQSAAIVINEIYFHPPSSWDEPEDVRQEFVELHNAGTDDIPLQGLLAQERGEV